uniref:Serine/arginine repetitive matrix protein 1-like n=1 Tax=Caenorhabditis tropicalis TaxID=1561998 RepID=A0A1I7TLH4_9PELO
MVRTRSATGVGKEVDYAVLSKTRKRTNTNSSTTSRESAQNSLPKRSRRKSRGVVPLSPSPPKGNTRPSRRTNSQSNGARKNGKNSSSQSQSASRNGSQIGNGTAATAKNDATPVQPETNSPAPPSKLKRIEQPKPIITVKVEDGVKITHEKRTSINPMTGRSAITNITRRLDLRNGPNEVVTMNEEEPPSKKRYSPWKPLTSEERDKELLRYNLRVVRKPKPEEPPKPHERTPIPVRFISDHLQFI